MKRITDYSHPVQFLIYSGGLVGMALFVVVASTLGTPQSKEPGPEDGKEKARIAFCATVLDVVGPGDKTCGPYLGQARQLLVQQKQVAEAAKPKPSNPNGWRETNLSGIYWRWCDSPDCTTAKVIGDNASVLAQVWCKIRACGDIYARINLISDSDVVIGWTNDTAYGDYGQKVQLTFQSANSGWSKARLTELKIGGMDAR